MRDLYQLNDGYAIRKPGDGLAPLSLLVYMEISSVNTSAHNSYATYHGPAVINFLLPHELMAGEEEPYVPF